jgi:fatty-acyl-CoA synthase
MDKESYLIGATTPTLLSVTMGRLLEESAARFPYDTAITSRWQNKSLTYQQLDHVTNEAALALLRTGIVRGDRVGVWSANRIEWIILQFAVARVGAILVSINPAYKEQELAYTVEHSRCRALFLSPQLRGFDCLEVALSVAKSSISLKHLICFDAVDSRKATDWTRFLALGRAESFHEVRRAALDVRHTDAVSIQYTSGTTGKPKGAVLTHYNLVNNGMLVGGRLHLGERDRICLPVPLFHCFGMVIGVIGAVAYGSSLVLPSEGFDAVECIKAIRDEGCTAFYGVPMMYIAILNHAEFATDAMKSLRTGLMGGAPCPAEVLRAAMDTMHMRDVAVVYGMTETSPISIQTTKSATFEQRINSVGTVHPHVELKIVDPVTGATVPRGETGELCVRGYLVMDGYWENPEATAASIDADRWMHTGDLATIRDDGHISIVGRTKDMLIRGGENIFPREIEEFLHTLPQVAEAQVFGIPDPLYGEQVCAWIRLKHGHSLDTDALRALCKGKIASFKIPAYVRFVNEFPCTASGKVQKFRMREIELAYREQAQAVVAPSI